MRTSRFVLASRIEALEAELGWAKQQKEAVRSEGNPPDRVTLVGNQTAKQPLRDK